MRMSDQETSLLQLAERVKDQDRVYNHALNKLQDQLQVQQTDIQYLLERTSYTEAMKQADCGDQPTRDARRAASWNSEINAGRSVTVDPADLPARGSHEAARLISPLVLQPAILFPRAQLTGNAQRREPHSRLGLTAPDNPLKLQT